jgi:RNA polymerase sigma-70 factor (ECF subfamily)
MAAIDPKEDVAVPGAGEGESHEALMARLYREHNQALIGFLMTRVESEAEARDVAQEAYVRMLQLDSHGAVSFLSGYLFKTAANIAVDRVRTRSIQRRASRGLDETKRREPIAPPERVLEAREELELIDRFVQELPAKCREAFYLHRLQEMSPPEIAAKLGVSKRMVHHYLVQALTHLRLRLDATESPK